MLQFEIPKDYPNTSVYFNSRSGTNHSLISLHDLRNSIFSSAKMTKDSINNWILTVLREITFYLLAALIQAIKRAVSIYINTNNGISRKSSTKSFATDN